MEAIKQLIGEAENAKIVGFNVTYPGFGYVKEAPPKASRPLHAPIHLLDQYQDLAEHQHKAHLTEA